MTSSIYGVSASSSRITGMMSGLDTDDFVKGMTSSILTKIAKQKQSKQLLEWKMDSYRSVSTALMSFQSKYLDYTNTSTNALTSSFYNVRSVSAQGENAGLVSISGYSPSSGQLKINDIISTAKTATALSKTNASSQEIKLDFDFGASVPVSNLAGKPLIFEYNDETYSITFDELFAPTSLNDVVSAINTLLADVEVNDGSNESLADRFELKASGTSIYFDFDTSNSNYDPADTLKLGADYTLINDVFGWAEGDDLTDPAIGTYDASAVTITNYGFDDVYAGKTLTFQYNGVNRIITMPASGASFASELQTEFDRAFGSGKVDVTVDPSGEITFTTADATSLLKIVAADSEFISDKYGLGQVTVGLSNRLLLTQAVGNMGFANGGFTWDASGDFDVTINGKTLSFNKDDSLQSILDKINADSDMGVNIEYLETTDTFSITAKNDGAAGVINAADFTDTNSFLAALMGYDSGNDIGTSPLVSQGKDAQISITYGGQTYTVTRGTNVFEIDGLTITLEDGAEDRKVMDGSDMQAISFSVNTDATDLVGKVKDMVEQFNDIMKLVHSELTTKYDREYPPLTDEQRAEMTEKQIEQWEEKAMAGLLFNDSTLRALSSELRFVFALAVPGIGNLSDFGIEVKNENGDYKTAAQITIDEAKLKAAIEADPEGFEALFLTGKADPDDNTLQQGLIGRMQDVMERYVKTTGQYKGSLISIAGLKDSYLTQESQLYKQIEDIDKVLTKLQKQLKMQQDRYYKQFTSLEVYISKMSAQSSWLMDLYS